jgi:hypothetical protein
MLAGGVITGTAGAALGAGCILGLGTALGCAAGLMSGAIVGGLAIWLASQRVLGDATVCLAALCIEEGNHGSGLGEIDGDRPLPVLGSETFDDRIAHLSKAALPPTANRG